jgi:hypothetical protein
VQSVTPTTVELRNGDAGYPRWDGEAWVLEFAATGAGAAGGGSAGGAAEGAGAAAAGPVAAPRKGALYVRNLTGSVVTIRILGADNSPQVDTTWEFAAYESANDPRGHYLELRGKGALPVADTARVELVTRKGARRILPVASTARWGSSSWLLELVPELLAGSGKLYVKNAGELPLKIWVLGADGRALYGDSPWTFEPKEGSAENKGLRLTYNDRDITMSGRESLRVERGDLATLYDGTLEKLGRWSKGGWTVDLSKAGK